MEQIKKIFINIAIVTLVVFLLDYIIGRTLRYYYFMESSGLHFNTTYALQKVNADIVILGASCARRHYVPEIFEDSLKMTFFNTGRGGQGIFHQLALLESVLSRYTPKVIIFDYPGINKNDYDNMSSLLPYYSTNNEIKTIIESRNPFIRIKLLSEVYPFNSQLIHIVYGNINTKGRIENKGYVPLFNECQTSLDSNNSREQNKVDSDIVNTLGSFLKRLKESKSKTYVVVSPIYRLEYNNYESELCGRMCSEYNIPFYNYSLDTTFMNHRKLFSDITHLNNNGAILLSKLVASRIKSDLDSFRLR